MTRHVGYNIMSYRIEDPHQKVARHVHGTVTIVCEQSFCRVSSFCLMILFYDSFFEK